MFGQCQSKLVSAAAEARYDVRDNSCRCGVRGQHHKNMAGRVALFVLIEQFREAVAAVAEARQASQLQNMNPIFDMMFTITK